LKPWFSLRWAVCGGPYSYTLVFGSVVGPYVAEDSVEEPAILGFLVLVTMLVIVPTTASIENSYL
jgi:hypothetical protein